MKMDTLTRLPIGKPVKTNRRDADILPIFSHFISYFFKAYKKGQRLRASLYEIRSD